MFGVFTLNEFFVTTINGVFKVLIRIFWVVLPNRLSVVVFTVRSIHKIYKYTKQLVY